MANLTHKMIHRIHNIRLAAVDGDQKIVNFLRMTDYNLHHTLSLLPDEYTRKQLKDYIDILETLVDKDKLDKINTGK